MPTIQASDTLKYLQDTSMTDNSEMKDIRNESTKFSVVSNCNPISEIISIIYKITFAIRQIAPRNITFYLPTICHTMTSHGELKLRQCRLKL
jgi:hypothetical protein